MGFSLHNLPEEQTVEVIVEGQLSMELRHDLLSQALFALQASGFVRLLIDVTRTVFGPAESMTDAFQVITYMRNLGFAPGIRIAFLQRGDDSRRKFFENAAQTDGLDLKYFNDRDEALLWLTNGLPDDSHHTNQYS